MVDRHKAEMLAYELRDLIGLEPNEAFSVTAYRDLKKLLDFKKINLVPYHALAECMGYKHIESVLGHDGAAAIDNYGNKFIAKQFTDDFVVKVDAHSKSARRLCVKPIYFSSPSGD